MSRISCENCFVYLWSLLHLSYNHILCFDSKQCAGLEDLCLSKLEMFPPGWQLFHFPHCDSAAQSLITKTQQSHKVTLATADQYLINILKSSLDSQLLHILLTQMPQNNTFYSSCLINDFFITMSVVSFLC